MIVRCRELNLRAVGSERKLVIRLHRAVDRQDDARAVRSIAAASGSRYERHAARPGADAPGPDTRRIQAKGYSEQEINVWKTEYDVVSTLRAAGHDVRAARRARRAQADPRRDRRAGSRDVVFNLLEEFHGEVDLRPERRRAISS